jgi:disulfide bond formation protein DsbB
MRYRRAVLAGAALLCAGLVAYALYSQQFQGLTPCPLCIFQRVGISALAVSLLLAALPGQEQIALRRIAGTLVLVVALSTAAVSVRHLYIQHLPEGQVPVCGASLNYMLDAFPLTDVLRKVLTGSGECHKVDWTFLGLAMPAWVLVWTLALGCIGFSLSWRRGR